MPYYMGDFYRGDYYEGDPFWGGILRVGRAVVKAATGFGRAPVAKAAPAAAGVATTAITRAGEIVRAVPGAISRTVTQHPVLSAAGAAGIAGILAGRAAAPGLPAGVAPRGFHLSKPHKGVSPHLVRNRRMRVTNPRALRRAIRRAHGFARLARRVLSFTSPRGHRGRMYFRKGRKRKA